ncbi:MAG: RdgB/HAM1 family non-canonical purine NTP pyrophosphatase [Chthoniobacterales bacterium]|nr:RdgB/HAM1 family non-canonical purine NTP pyrophosphatase [Chthoniobacterales bacterium]
MLSLCLATRNAHKTREFVEMLGAEVALEDLSAHPEIEEVIEDGATFAENARLKAVSVSRFLPGFVLADDSGLEVDSLGGGPGLWSARFAGAGASDEANRRKLLEELAALGPDAAHTARFCCVLALARAGEVLATFEGTAAGEIVRQARGAAGFGYDPLFQPNEFSKTFAELSAATKNSISHRGRAVTKLKQFLRAANLLT